MAFSIPQTIYPTYTIPGEGLVNNVLKVGTSIKDLPEGSETKMKRANDVAVVRIQQKHEADTRQFAEDFKSAEIKAGEAEKIIGSARNKKAAAITLLALAVIGAVAVIAIAIATETWPLLFVAAPFVIGIVPSSYYTHIFRKMVNKLERDISAPSKMVRPVLILPVYNPKQDLDLRDSRVLTQNRLSAMTVKQLANSNISQDEIVGYELLHGVGQVKAEKSAAFYAKCIQLINAYGVIVKQYKNYTGKAESEYGKLQKELRTWKSEQDSYIRSQEWELHEQEKIARQVSEARMRGECINVQPRSFVGRLLSSWELERMKSQTTEAYYKRESENNKWYDSTVQAINAGYRQADANIESQYTAAKAEAV